MAGAAGSDAGSTGPGAKGQKPAEEVTVIDFNIEVSSNGTHFFVAAEVRSRKVERLVDRGKFGCEIGTFGCKRLRSRSRK